MQTCKEENKYTKVFPNKYCKLSTLQDTFVYGFVSFVSETNNIVNVVVSPTNTVYVCTISESELEKLTDEEKAYWTGKEDSYHEGMKYESSPYVETMHNQHYKVFPNKRFPCDFHGEENTLHTFVYFDDKSCETYLVRRKNGCLVIGVPDHLFEKLSDGDKNYWTSTEDDFTEDNFKYNDAESNKGEKLI